MAGLFVKQAAIYAEARPTYPEDWFSKLASFTCHHKLAWDVGTGNGQAAISVKSHLPRPDYIYIQVLRAADHYEQVMATDVSEAQLKQGTPDPKFRYIHTPLSTSDDELVSMDLVTVAQAVHWFNLPRFYSLVKRVLRNPGGAIAVWGYNYRMSSSEDTAKRFLDTTLPYWDPRARYVIDGYRNLPFLFKSVGMGGEGNPIIMDTVVLDVTFDRFWGLMRSWSAVATAREQGVALLSEDVVKKLESDRGGSSVVRTITHKVPMPVGTPERDHMVFDKMLVLLL